MEQTSYTDKMQNINAPNANPKGITQPQKNKDYELSFSVLCQIIFPK